MVRLYTNRPTSSAVIYKYNLNVIVEAKTQNIRKLAAVFSQIHSRSEIPTDIENQKYDLPFAHIKYNNDVTK